MSQCFLCRDSFLGIELEELLQQICSLVTRTWKKLQCRCLNSVCKECPTIRLTSVAFFGFGGGRDASIVIANGDCTATISSFAGFPVTCGYIKKL